MLLIDFHLGTVQACNEVAQKMFGYDLSELLGQNVKKLAAEPHRSNHDQYLKNYLTTGVAKVIMNNIRF